MIREIKSESDREVVYVIVDNGKVLGYTIEQRNGTVTHLGPDGLTELETDPFDAEAPGAVPGKRRRWFRRG